MSDKVKIGYKVVGLRVGEFRSVVIDDPYSVKYEISSTSKPLCGCGPLTLFSKLTDAIGWLDAWGEVKHSNLRILEAQYVKSQHSSVWFRGDYKFGDEELHRQAGLPMGVKIVYASEVTPIRDVTPVCFLPDGAH